MMLMLNFSGETMLVGLSSMPRAQSEMLTCVKACPGPQGRVVYISKLLLSMSGGSVEN